MIGPETTAEEALALVRDNSQFDKNDPDSMVVAGDWLREQGVSDEVVDEVVEQLEGNAQEFVDAIEEHGPGFKAFLENEGSIDLNDLSTNIERFQDAYQGAWDSLADYVEDWFQQTDDFQPSDNWFHPSNYVDWERMGHDLELSGDIWTHTDEDGKIHVFFNH